MSLTVDVAADGARSPLGLDRASALARAVLRAENVSDALVSIAFISRRAIARLNRIHLGHRGPTDVISFGLRRDDAGPVLGDIYISPDIARQNAGRYGRGVREEIARLIVHGTLHVLGYDHPTGEDRLDSPMWRRQETLLRRARRRGTW